MKPDTRSLAAPRIVIIGAGVSGILAGIQLRRRGIDSFTIFEKAAGLGGTWLHNSYPGLSCDVPIHVYVYSFARDAGWTHRYASGPEILRYYRETAEEYGLAAHVRFGTEIVAARWHDDAWLLTAADGQQHVADIVISAVGRLHHPSFPDIAGLDRFAGPVFHSAQWRHDVDLGDKRLGIIGAGSTAVQIVSALNTTARSITLFQRTPQWVMPAPNAPLHPVLRTLLRFLPPVKRWYRRTLENYFIKIGREVVEGTSPLADRCRESLANIADPVLRAKLTPDYAPGCKRFVTSADFHEVIQRPNIVLTTEPIDRITEGGVSTRDGQHHQLDALVLATGFKAAAFLQPMTVTGQDGVVLDDLWAETNLNYKSVAIPHMPNFFTINGPYTPTGASSHIPVAEAQVEYVMQCIDHIRRTGTAIAPEPERTRVAFEDMRDKARNAIWATGGCASWLLDKTGVPMINPQALDEVKADLARPDFDDFETIAPTVSQATAGMNG